MFKDDDEEEENTFGVTRYPCMPSLVALQQMRNRLHLAYLGRKLMKWTALATGRELRRLAQELYELYDGFAEDLRNAFILLARCRYFCPNLNSVVSEDIAKKAAVLVHQCGRTVSGVKIVQFEIFETEYPPYPHLGLEKGGQTILETKKAWLELLKRLIMMMQLRAAFLMVELANKNANKKWNVLSKMVIPRVNLSCQYITSELEEIEREDNFRLKRFKELKIKKQKAKEVKMIKTIPEECALCAQESDMEICICESNAEFPETDKVSCCSVYRSEETEIDHNKKPSKMKNEINVIRQKIAQPDSKTIFSANKTKSSELIELNQKDSNKSNNYSQIESKVSETKASRKEFPCNCIGTIPRNDSKICICKSNAEISETNKVSFLSSANKTKSSELIELNQKDSNKSNKYSQRESKVLEKKASLKEFPCGCIGTIPRNDSKICICKSNADISETNKVSFLSCANKTKSSELIELNQKDSNKSNKYSQRESKVLETKASRKEFPCGCIVTIPRNDSKICICKSNAEISETNKVSLLSSANKTKSSELIELNQKDSNKSNKCSQRGSKVLETKASRKEFPCGCIGTIPRNDSKICSCKSNAEISETNKVSFLSSANKTKSSELIELNQKDSNKSNQYSLKQETKASRKEFPCGCIGTIPRNESNICICKSNAEISEKNKVSLLSSATKTKSSELIELNQKDSNKSNKYSQRESKGLETKASRKEFPCGCIGTIPRNDSKICICKSNAEISETNKVSFLSSANKTKPSELIELNQKDSNKSNKYSQIECKVSETKASRKEFPCGCIVTIPRNDSKICICKSNAEISETNKVSFLSSANKTKSSELIELNQKDSNKSNKYSQRESEVLETKASLKEFPCGCIGTIPRNDSKICICKSNAEISETNKVSFLSSANKTKPSELIELNQKNSNKSNKYSQIECKVSETKASRKEFPCGCIGTIPRNDNKICICKSNAEISDTNKVSFLSSANKTKPSELIELNQKDSNKSNKNSQIEKKVSETKASRKEFPCGCIGTIPRNESNICICKSNAEISETNKVSFLSCANKTKSSELIALNQKDSNKSNKYSQRESKVLETKASRKEFPCGCIGTIPRNDSKICICKSNAEISETNKVSFLSSANKTKSSELIELNQKDSNKSNQYSLKQETKASRKEFPCGCIGTIPRNESNICICKSNADISETNKVSFRSAYGSEETEIEHNKKPSKMKNKINVMRLKIAQPDSKTLSSAYKTKSSELIELNQKDSNKINKYSQRESKVSETKASRKEFPCGCIVTIPRNDSKICICKSNAEISEKNKVSLLSSATKTKSSELIELNQKDSNKSNQYSLKQETKASRKEFPCGCIGTIPRNESNICICKSNAEISEKNKVSLLSSATKTKSSELIELNQKDSNKSNKYSQRESKGLETKASRKEFPCGCIGTIPRNDSKICICKSNAEISETNKVSFLSSANKTKPSELIELNQKDSNKSNKYSQIECKVSETKASRKEFPCGCIVTIPRNDSKICICKSNAEISETNKVSLLSSANKTKSSELIELNQKDSNKSNKCSQRGSKVLETKASRKEFPCGCIGTIPRNDSKICSCKSNAEISETNKVSFLSSANKTKSSELIELNQKDSNKSNKCCQRGSKVLETKASRKEFPCGCIGTIPRNDSKICSCKSNAEISETNKVSFLSSANKTKSSELIELNQKDSNKSNKCSQRGSKVLETKASRKEFPCGCIGTIPRNDSKICICKSYHLSPTTQNQEANTKTVTSICSCFQLTDMKFLGGEDLKLVSSEKIVSTNDTKDKLKEKKNESKPQKEDIDNQNVESVKEIIIRKYISKDGNVHVERTTITTTFDKNMSVCKCCSESEIYKKPSHVGSSRTEKVSKLKLKDDQMNVNFCRSAPTELFNAPCSITISRDRNKNDQDVQTKSTYSTQSASLASLDYSSCNKTVSRCNTCSESKATKEEKTTQTCPSNCKQIENVKPKSSYCTIKIFAKADSDIPTDEGKNIELTKSILDLLRKIILQGSKPPASSDFLKRRINSICDSCHKTGGILKQKSTCPTNKLIPKLLNEDRKKQGCSCQKKSEQYIDKKETSNNEGVQFMPSLETGSVENAGFGKKNVSTETMTWSIRTRPVVKKHSCESKGNAVPKHSIINKSISVCSCKPKKSFNNRESKCPCSKSKNALPEPKKCSCLKVRSEGGKCKCYSKKATLKPHSYSAPTLAPTPDSCLECYNFDSIDSLGITSSKCASTNTDLEPDTKNIWTQKDSFDSCCSQKKPPNTGSETSAASNCSLCGKKDATTLTRRSDRYDVRPLRLLMQSKSVPSACLSDSFIVHSKRCKNTRVKRCTSYNDSKQSYR